MTSFIPNVPYEGAVWQAIQDLFTIESEDELSPVTIDTAAPYYVTIGDRGQFISADAANTNLDFSFLGKGQEITVVVDNAAPASAYSGVLAKWAGAGSPANDRIGVLPEGVHRIIRKSNWLFNLSSVPMSFSNLSAYAAEGNVARALCVASAGQSNMVKFFTNAGLRGLQEEWVKIGLARSFWFVDGATGATALLEASKPSAHWWNPSTGTPGTAATNFIAKMEEIPADQRSPDVILWCGGEADTSAMGSGTISAAGYASGFAELFDYLRSYSYQRIDPETGVKMDLSGVPVIITPTGAHDKNVAHYGFEGVREAQLAAAAADSTVHIGPEIYDLSRRLMDAHLTFKGYRTFGRRMAYVLDNVLNGASHDLGPAIGQVTFSGHDMVIPISNSITMFRPGAGPFPGAFPLDMFGCRKVSDPAIYATPLSAAWSGSGSSPTLTITHAEVVSSGYQCAYPLGAANAQRLGRFPRQLSQNQLPLRTYAP